MSGNCKLNGSDYLMLGFDHELRRRGFAGNSCQIVLKLGGMVTAEKLELRLKELLALHPILNARPTGMIYTRWKLPNGAAFSPKVVVSKEQPGACQRIFNEPLAVSRGELMRFDLVEGANGKMRLIFTWAHALMDAPGAEHFLAAMGSDNVKLPENSLREERVPRLPLRKRCKQAWRTIHQMDGFCRAAPKSPGMRHSGAATELHYRVESFSAEETAKIRANGASHCGVLGDAQYHAAVAAVELHKLHLRLGAPSPSYVLPLPVGLRRKGTIEPLFSNQVAMLMLQFLPEHLDSTDKAVAALKSQTEQGMRSGLLESGVMLSELFRFLPRRVYMSVLKQGLKGEICSMFYGDTAAVNPNLYNFLGVPVEDFAHVAAVTPTPGLGVIYYYFKGELRVTVLHSLQTLTDAEAAEFGAALRKRLLNP
jgi:hypothetical protein